MSSDTRPARAHILDRIGAALNARGSSAAERQANLASRLAVPPPPIIPDRAPANADGRADYFRARAEETSATTERVAGFDDLPGAIAAYLRRRDSTGAIKAQPRPPFTDLNWAPLEVAYGPADDKDGIGLVLADGGAAETGTLFLMSGPDAPTALNFLPETLIAVLALADLAGDYEGAWRIVRDASGNAFPPRTVNWISGPSRSADIEQRVLMGVHGPRNLHIIVVDGDDGS